MTLIVGLRSPKRVQVLSDTRISHPDVTQIEEVPGRLKVVLLGSDICVAYAGSADWSLDIIRSAPSALSPSEALEYFESSHIAAAQAVDFLVSCASTNSLFRIAGGRSEAVASECWIGDSDGFDEYQQRKVDAPLPPGTTPEFENLSRAIHAFSSVVADRIVPTVAGLSIRVGSRPGGFVYLDEARAYYPTQSIPSGVWTPLSFGGAPQGGFAYTLLVPRVAGASVVAAHFLQGSLGFVYAPLQTEKPIQVSNVTHDQLKHFVQEQFGVPVEGAKF